MANEAPFPSSRKSRVPPSNWIMRAEIGRPPDAFLEFSPDRVIEFLKHHIFIFGANAGAIICDTDLNHFLAPSLEVRLSTEIQIVGSCL